MSKSQNHIEKKIKEELLAMQFSNIRHISYDKEFGIYRAIATGDMKGVDACRHKYAEVKIDENGGEKNGLLSKDPLLNTKYHTVIFIAIATRYCVRYGLARETAYSISDVLIQELDDCRTPEQVEEIRDRAANILTTYMQRNKKSSVYSMPIARCLEYIQNNLQNDLKLETIAAQFNLNPSYLSRLFKQEMKTPLSAYIKQQRLISACGMLELSNLSISEISDMLHFSSQSHFTSSFRTQYGVTPKQYRDLRARVDWNN